MNKEKPDAPVVEPMVDLTPEATATSKKVKHEDNVVCRNRGQRVLEEQFDGNHYKLPPGLFKVRYDAALHFQRRLIVPGTRNLATNGYQSFIGILRTADTREIPIDTPELCLPFTNEELRAMGEKVEAIAREGEASVERVPIGSAMARTLRSTSSRGRAAGIDASQQATEDAAAAAESVLDTPEESATRDAEAEAQADGYEPAARKGGKKK